MRILFAAKIIEDRLFQPPGLYAMSATLKEAGHETFIVDARSEDAVLAAVERVRPGLLGIATPTAHYPFFQRTAERIKKRRAEVFTVVGGVHATLVPEIVGDPGVDAVCRGEGDRVMPELVGRLERGETPHDQVGFWFSENGTIYENPVAPLIEELDSLPFADRSLTDPIPICREFPFGVFHASRGCPYGCTFCSNKSLSELYDQRGKYYRSHSPERFAAEVREAHGTYGYRMLLFMSEIFGLSIAWLERFVELYREGPALPFWCMARPAIFDEARARLLRDANCRVVEMGLEAGNEEYRQNVFKRHETNAQLIEAVKTAHRFGLYVQAATSSARRARTSKRTWRRSGSTWTRGSTYRRCASTSRFPARSWGTGFSGIATRPGARSRRRSRPPAGGCRGTSRKTARGSSGWRCCFRWRRSRTGSSAPCRG